MDNDTTGTKFVVTLSSTTASSLYASKTSRTLTLVFTGDAIVDTLGNKLAAATKTVTLTADQSAPTITDATVKTTADGYLKSLTLTASENVGTVDASKITVVDSNGVVATLSDLLNTTPVVDGKTITFAPASTAVAGQYNFTFAKGFLKDTGATPNSNTAFSKTLTLGTATTATTFDVTSALGAIDTTTRANTITVTFPEAVKGGSVDGSATLASNYTLNGSALPDGTVITLNAADAPSAGTVAQTIATITLPAGTVATTDAAATLNVKNIKNTAGTKTVKAVTKTVGITDNVAPELKSAKVNTDGSIVITLSEALNSLVDTDFVVKAGTSTIAGTVTAGTGSDAGKVVFTPTTATEIKNATSTITVNTVTGATSTDAAGNVLVEEASVTATK